MNTPAFRRAGILSLSGIAARLPRLHLSKLEIALLGAAAVLAIVIVAFGFTSSDEPDPIETAAVLPPRLETKTAGVEVTAEEVKPIATAAVQPAAAPATAAQAPAQAPLLTAPAAAPATGRFEKSAPTAAIGPDERGEDIATPLPSATADQGPDPAATTAIATEGLRGSIDVQVAETETEVAMLEQQTGMIDGATATAAQATAGPLPDLRPAKVVKYANLRDGPADEAKVIVVVPANAEIEAEVDCNWCTVVYKGQRGYMYKNLIRRTVAEEAKAGQGLF